MCENVRCGYYKSSLPGKDLAVVCSQHLFLQASGPSEVTVFGRLGGRSGWRGVPCIGLGKYIHTGKRSNWQGGHRVGLNHCWQHCQVRSREKSQARRNGRWRVKKKLDRSRWMKTKEGHRVSAGTPPAHTLPLGKFEKGASSSGRRWSCVWASASGVWPHVRGMARVLSLQLSGLNKSRL